MLPQNTTGLGDVFTPCDGESVGRRPSDTGRGGWARLVGARGADQHFAGAALSLHV